MREDFEENIEEYNSDGRVIYCKIGDYEYWKEYDEFGRHIRTSNKKGKESIREYDSSGNLIHTKDFSGYEEWFQYDSYNNLIQWRSNEYD